MKAILKDISNDYYDITHFNPDDTKCFSLDLLLQIGADDHHRIDNFELFICTPEWLSAYQWQPILMRNIMLVRSYDLKKIKKLISDYIEQCEGSDWLEIVQKLSRFFAWEYEDYQT